MGFVWDEATLGGGKTNSGSFTGNPYGNPQMGSYGGGSNPYGGGFGEGGGAGGGGGGSQWFTDPTTGYMSWTGGIGGGQQAQGYSPAMADYYGGFTGPGDMWTGGTPNHYGQDYTFDPTTGQSGWQSNNQYLGTPGSGNSMFFKGTDPKTGNQYTDIQGLMRMMQGMMGGGGGGGYQSFTPSEFGGGQITPPGAYGGGDWDVPGNVVNVHDVVEAYRPTMEANIGQGFAEAGNRLGQSGFAMSTPYATALGDVERLARAQMNQRGLEFEYDAGKFDATNQMQTMFGQNAENFNAWQQSGNWDMDAQGQNSQNAFNQWMAQNQWASENNQGQNQYNQSQQNWLMQLLGGMI